MKKSDDFGFSSFGDEDGGDKPPAGDKLLTHILREGPPLGVHALIWCDSHNNLTRWFERPTLDDLQWRVLMQMGAADSSHLMDSPAASQLGVHRAILYHEERGDFERFRPYAVPSNEWLHWVRDTLTARQSATQNA